MAGVWRSGSAQPLVSDPTGTLSWIDQHRLLADGSIIRTDTGQVRPLGHSSIQVSAVIAPDHAITGGFDRTVRIWDLRRPMHPLIALDAANATAQLRVDPNHGRAISRGADPDARIELWDITDTARRTVNAGGRVENLLSDHADRIAIQVDETTRLLTSTLAPVGSFDGVPLGFRPGRHELVVRRGGKLAVHDSETGAPMGELGCPDPVRPTEEIWHVAFSRDGAATVLSCVHSAWLRDTDAAGWRLVTRSRDDLQISALAVDDLGHVAIGHHHGKLQRWDAPPGAPARAAREWTGHAETINELEIRGDTLVSFSWDGTLRMWDFPSGRALGDAFKSRGNAAMSPDRAWIATADGSAVVSLWDGAQDRLVDQIPTADALTRVVFIDARRIVVGGKAGELELIELYDDDAGHGRALTASGG